MEYSVVLLSLLFVQLAVGENPCNPLFVRWSRVRLNLTARVSGPYSREACQRACTLNEHPARAGYPLPCFGFNHKEGPNSLAHDCQIFQEDQLYSIDGRVEADDRYSFYWKYCVKTEKVCNSYYHFSFYTDRYMDHIEVARRLTTNRLEDCLGKCLDETEFTCRSVSYNRTEGGCYLSPQNQLSKPSYIRVNNNPNFRVDYYESNCYNNTFSFQHTCRQDGITVSVESKYPYTGALYGLYDFFTCRAEPQEQKQFSYFFPYPSVSRNCTDSIRVKGDDMLLEVVLSTDGVEPLYFITPEDLTYQARCPTSDKVLGPSKVGTSVQFFPKIDDANTLEERAHSSSSALNGSQLHDYDRNSTIAESSSTTASSSKKEPVTLPRLDTLPDTIERITNSTGTRQGTKISVVVKLPEKNYTDTASSQLSTAEATIVTETSTTTTTTPPTTTSTTTTTTTTPTTTTTTTTPTTTSTITTTTTTSSAAPTSVASSSSSSSRTTTSWPYRMIYDLFNASSARYTTRISETTPLRIINSFEGNNVSDAVVPTSGTSRVSTSISTETPTTTTTSTTTRATTTTTTPTTTTTSTTTTAATTVPTTTLTTAKPSSTVQRTQASSVSTESFGNESTIAVGGTPTTTAPVQPILFDVFHGGQPVEAVVVGSKITLSFTPYYAISPTYMTVAGCQVEPVGSLYEWERTPLAIIKDGCQSDSVGLVCPPERTDFGIRVVAEAFRYQSTAQVQYTCLVRICQFAPCPQVFCPPVDGCTGGISNIIPLNSFQAGRIRQKRQFLIPPRLIPGGLPLPGQLGFPPQALIPPNTPLSPPRPPSVYQQYLAALAGDHIVSKRMIVVNSENELQYYLRTGNVPSESLAPGIFRQRAT